ncbi:hypothetical protein FGG08_000665 [Glutinoglossum americanum]|uniref:RING-type E3 ubiquitin transferase n=1 Tax=Glutinoglossum americanum TaxID=1670608 RepID=A0A9P8IEW6_9PEZI|nr:hypothetical protein FGG08_000665 [Glutinoglossum americanum]
MWIWANIFSNPTTAKVRIPNLSATEPWASVKPHVAAALGLPLERCRFFHKGKILEDRMGTLFQCSIKSDEVISVQELQALPTEEKFERSDDMGTSVASQQGTGVAPSQAIESETNEADSVDPPEQASVCDACFANPRRKKCRECGCNICGTKDDDPENIDPPLTSLPEDDWYCPSCKNNTDHIVQPGHGSEKHFVKKARKGDSSKRWGRGMANVGHSKKCTIVSGSHRGPIPGIEVGQTWGFRKGVGEDGVHRPIVSGIAGSVKNGGAVSIVIASGYPEDEDNGDWFMYTGSGGKDLSTKNRRTGKQTFDQELTNANLALAATCDTPISKLGGVAKNWRNSKGIRVVRNYKLGKHHPKYAPELGNRYDGIYKVVRYFPERGKSGFQVYRYELRRDDPIPAPWTKKGEARIKELGLEMIFPETYDRSSEVSSKAKGVSKPIATDYEVYREPSPSPSVLGKRKRLYNPLATIDTFPDLAVVITARPSRKQDQPSDQVVLPKKTPVFDIPLILRELIGADIDSNPSHQRLWSSIMDQKPSSLRGFIAALERELNCPVCQDFIQKPITNPCGHIACLACMKGSVEGFGPKCPNCRASLIKIDSGDENSKEKNPKLDEKRKRIWRSQVQIDSTLVDVIRYYNEDYGKEKESQPGR